MTIKELYQTFIAKLHHIYSTGESNKIADMVFEKFVSVTKPDIIVSPAHTLDDEIIEKINDALDELLQHKPVQYILGEAWFCNMTFLVNEHVLIPRPETEELVKRVVDDLRATIYDLRNDDQDIANRTSKIVNILDIGTGSGCIAIALKKNLSNAYITGIDISDESLQVAQKNASINKATIDFKKIDFLDDKEWKTLGTFDIIVSNPPYIPTKEKTHLDKNVTAYEPSGALFVPDENPVLFYEKIALFAVKHLQPNGKVYVEIHEEFAQQTAEAFLKYFINVEIKKDMLEKDRMITATQFR